MEVTAIGLVEARTLVRVYHIALDLIVPVVIPLQQLHIVMKKKYNYYTYNFLFKSLWLKTKNENKVDPRGSM